MDICFQIVCFDCGNDAAVSLYNGEVFLEFSTNPSLSPGFPEGQMWLRSVVEVQGMKQIEGGGQVSASGRGQPCRH